MYFNFVSIHSPLVRYFYKSEFCKNWGYHPNTHINYFALSRRNIKIRFEQSNPRDNSFLVLKGICNRGEEHRKRKCKLNVYLLDEECEILNAKADEAEISKSRYIRNVILFGAA